MYLDFEDFLEVEDAREKEICCLMESQGHKKDFFFLNLNPIMGLLLGLSTNVNIPFPVMVDFLFILLIRY